MERHVSNAQAVAEHLEAHPRVFFGLRPADLAGALLVGQRLNALLARAETPAVGVEDTPTHWIVRH